MTQKKIFSIQKKKRIIYLFIYLSICLFFFFDSIKNFFLIQKKRKLFIYLFIYLLFFLTQKKFFFRFDSIKKKFSAQNKKNFTSENFAFSIEIEI